MSKGILKASCILIPLIFTSAAIADDKGLYVGGSLGYSSIDTLSGGEIDALLATGGITSTSSVDDSDLGWKFFAGFNFNQYFGIEMAYVDLGEAEASSVITAPTAGTAAIAAEADGFSFAAVGRYPLSNNIDVFGKVGVFAWDVEGTGNVTSGATTVALNGDTDGTDVMFGVGGEYEITKNIGVRAEWERYKLDSDDVDLFSIGLEYDF